MSSFCVRIRIPVNIDGVQDLHIGEELRAEYTDYEKVLDVFVAQEHEKRERARRRFPIMLTFAGCVVESRSEQP